MYSIFEDIKAIYSKKNLDTSNTEAYKNIAIMKWLILDEDNHETLKEIVKYFFSVEPVHFLYLLYFNIGKQVPVPFLHKIDKEEKEEDNTLYLKIKQTLKWSDRELLLHKRLLDKVIDNKYWANQLGVKC
jgi:hypothetical protein